MITYAGLISSELILPMYLENIKGYSAFDTGLALMPGAIVMGIMNPITGIIFDKYGARYLAINWPYHSNTWNLWILIPNT